MDMMEQIKVGAIRNCLKAVGIEPTLAGIVKATGHDPVQVHDAIAQLVEVAPVVAQTIMDTKARLDRLEGMIVAILTNQIQADGVPLTQFERDATASGQFPKISIPANPARSAADE